MPADRELLGYGAVLMATGVAAGAFGAHALKARLDAAKLNAFEVGVRYQLIHAVALLALAAADARGIGSASAAGFGLTSGPSGGGATTLVARVPQALLAGTALFSGSLYALATAPAGALPRGFGLLTPLGGLIQIGAWATLAGNMLFGK